MLVHQRIIPSKEQNQSWNRPWNLRKSLALSGYNFPGSERPISQTAWEISRCAFAGHNLPQCHRIHSSSTFPWKIHSPNPSNSFHPRFRFISHHHHHHHHHQSPAPMSSESQRSPWSPRFKVWEESSGSIFELDFSSPLEAPSARRRRNAVDRKRMDSSRIQMDRVG